MDMFEKVVVGVSEKMGKDVDFVRSVVGDMGLLYEEGGKYFWKLEWYDNGLVMGEEEEWEKVLIEVCGKYGIMKEGYEEVVVMKNVIIEMVRDEDGVLSVEKKGVGDWGWLGYVMENEGGFDSVFVGDVKGKLDSFVESEMEFIEEGDIEEMKKLFMCLLEEVYDENEVSFLGCKEYGVECDGSFVVMVCKM